MELPVSEDVTHEGLRKLLHCHQEGIRGQSYLLPVFYTANELEKSRPEENWAKAIGTVALGQAILERVTASSCMLRLEGQALRSIHSAKPRYFPVTLWLAFTGRDCIVQW